MVTSNLNNLGPPSTCSALMITNRPLCPLPIPVLGGTSGYSVVVDATVVVVAMVVGTTRVVVVVVRGAVVVGTAAVVVGSGRVVLVVVATGAVVAVGSGLLSS